MNRREVLFGGIGAGLATMAGKAATPEPEANIPMGGLGEQWKQPTVEEAAEDMYLNGWGPGSLEFAMSLVIREKWPKEIFTIEPPDFRLLLLRVPDKLKPVRLGTPKFCCDLMETPSNYPMDKITVTPGPVQLPLGTFPCSVWMQCLPFPQRVSHHFLESLRGLERVRSSLLESHPEIGGRLVTVRPEVHAKKEGHLFEFWLDMHLFGDENTKREEWLKILGPPNLKNRPWAIELERA